MCRDSGKKNVNIRHVNTEICVYLICCFVSTTNIKIRREAAKYRKKKGNEKKMSMSIFNFVSLHAPIDRVWFIKTKYSSQSTLG